MSVASHIEEEQPAPSVRLTVTVSPERAQMRYEWSPPASQEQSSKRLEALHVVSVTESPAVDAAPRRPITRAPAPRRPITRAPAQRSRLCAPSTQASAGTVQAMVVVQAPAAHVDPAPHARPQAPQFAPSVIVFTHADPHIAVPAGHAQVPPVQMVPPEQARPQLPQFAALVARAVSQPSAAAALQSPKPALQANPQAPVPEQVGAFAFAGVGHGAVVLPRPSALQVLREETLAQAVVPGVQIHEVQVVPEHVDAPGHVSVVLVSPSLLHVRTVRASTHDDDPGVHASARHAPASQRCEVAHAIGVDPSPSALQTERVLASAQVALPGEHVCATHAPAAQLWPAAQAVVVLASPSALHTLRDDVPAQVAAPGTQTRGEQVPPPLHDCPSGQGIGVVPPPSALHTTRSRLVGSQLVAPGVQTFAVHLPPRQVSLAAHAVVVLAAPRASQVRWCDGSAQVDSPGAQVWRAQALAAVQ